LTKIRYITVLFKKTQKTHIFRCSHPEIDVGNDVLVKTQRGLEVGEVVSIEDEADTKALTQVEGKVVRRLKPEDYETLEELARKEVEAKKRCEEHIAELGLPMKLLEVEYLFDGRKAIFYFTSETRVDFRELVRRLAGDLKIRVEMRQIGVRDEARMVGGLGPCGRNLCCATFLSTFEPVSVRMAKEQGLPVNTFKISGLCGRLMCCLKYEYDNYAEFQRCAPPVGSEVKTPVGRGRVAGYQVARDGVLVEFETGVQQSFRLEELEYRGKKLKPCWQSSTAFSEGASEARKDPASNQTPDRGADESEGSSEGARVSGLREDVLEKEGRTRGIGGLASGESAAGIEGSGTKERSASDSGGQQEGASSSESAQSAIHEHDAAQGQARSERSGEGQGRSRGPREAYGEEKGQGETRDKNVAESQGGARVERQGQSSSEAQNSGQGKNESAGQKRKSSRRRRGGRPKQPPQGLVPKGEDFIAPGSLAEAMGHEEDSQ